MSKKPPPRPIFQSKTGRFYLWAEIIRHARRAPSTWWLALADVPEATVTAIRYRKHPDLRPPDGTLEAELRNRTSTDNGGPRGDLWIRFVPKEKE